MPSCENCGRKWQWKAIVLKTLKLTNKVNCPYCGKPQYIIPKSRKKTAVFSFLPAFLIISSGRIFDLGVLGVILLAAILLIGTLSLYPFFMKLSSEDKTFQP
ncbi:TIGR04104 family putative zinc finger protein [Planococcus sp. ISL-110]|uniref:TIGR04104 family putative zinc finger protein n=1 Tax=Planococcus sp. ISL-110 TaxID=2819167 RepID=UPI001BE613F4|nr:TIGR04104 family putative zinc finger protein [Planococcus sp. ISL-110]MBT2571106.1 hypothetical protein [Planococcus sp. ISL-110]